MPIDTPESDVAYVVPDRPNLIRLLPVARFIFSATFADRFDPLELARFCDRVYALDGAMADDFDNPHVDWLLAMDGQQPIGYAKVTPLRAPATGAPPDARELQQIYVLPQWQGAGIASGLMTRVLETAIRRGASALYLTVFDFNVRATRFYARHGFCKVGVCDFVLEQTVIEDGIWRRMVTKADRP